MERASPYHPQPPLTTEQIPTSPYREDQEQRSANAMADSTSWRDLLKDIIKDPQERERVAAELGKNAVTLTRWSTGESQPRQQHLRQLLRVLPTDLRGQFVALVQQEDASFHDEAFPDSPSNLDPDFLRGVWKMRAETSSVLLFWTLCKHVLQHALFQLDRQHAGMSMTLVQCMPPAPDGTIKSLREVFGRGTPPWSAELEREAMFLGAESLAGYVVSMCRPERSEEHTSELQSHLNLVCRLLLEKKKLNNNQVLTTH